MDHDAHNIIVNKQITNQPQEIHIGKRCWIGFNSTILKDCTLSENTIIAANSTITHHYTQTNTIIGGVPGKVIKENINWK